MPSLLVILFKPSSLANICYFFFFFFFWFLIFFSGTLGRKQHAVLYSRMTNQLPNLPSNLPHTPFETANCSHPGSPNLCLMQRTWCVERTEVDQEEKSLAEIGSLPISKTWRWPWNPTLPFCRHPQSRTILWTQSIPGAYSSPRMASSALCLWPQAASTLPYIGIQSSYARQDERKRGRGGKWHGNMMK